MGAEDPEASAPLPPLVGDGVVGSMSAHWQQWKRMGAPRAIVQWLRGGVPLVWASPPQPVKIERAQQEKKLIEEIGALVKSGAFKVEDTKFISPTFIIPKRDGGTRLIHDLRHINKSIAPPKFTLRGAKDAASVVNESNWLVSLDLMHGYQQVAMHRKARQYLGAQWKDKTVVSTVLPFGLNLSPYIFTRITSWLARQIRERFKLRVAVYVDDFLLGGDTREELAAGMEKVKDFFSQLGVILSPKTSQDPSQCIEFLGFLWNSATKEISVTPSRRREYRREVKNLLRHPQSLAVWRKVIGKLLFLREAVGTTLRHTRSLMKLMQTARKGHLLEATGEARDDLLWWLDRLRSLPRLSLKTQPVTAVISTDASDNGLGAVVEMFGNTATSPQTLQGVMEGRKTLEAPSRNPNPHINAKEIEALLETLRQNQEQLENRRVLWYTDNTTAKAAIARQGTQNISSPAWEMTKEVVDLAARNNIELVPRWVPGRLNGGADKLSRIGEKHSEWKEALSKIFLTWGPLSEDPCGFTADPTAILETLEWAGKRTLLAPRTKDIGIVVPLLAKVATKEIPHSPPSAWEAMAVMITPLWRGARWWPLLEELRVSFLPLGRLKHPDLVGWEERNRHPSNWTASLIPTRTLCGHREQRRHIRRFLEASLDGDTIQEEKKMEN